MIRIGKYDASEAVSPSATELRECSQWPFTAVVNRLPDWYRRGCDRLCVSCLHWRGVAANIGECDENGQNPQGCRIQFFVPLTPHIDG